MSTETTELPERIKSRDSFDIVEIQEREKIEKIKLQIQAGTYLSSSSYEMAAKNLLDLEQKLPDNK